MTADALAQVIYANLIEQGHSVTEFQGPKGRTGVGDEWIDLVAIAIAILKAQNDEAAMQRVYDAVSLPEFDAAAARRLY